MTFVFVRCRILSVAPAFTPGTTEAPLLFSQPLFPGHRNVPEKGAGNGYHAFAPGPEGLGYRKHANAALPGGRQRERYATFAEVIKNPTTFLPVDGIRTGSAGIGRIGYNGRMIFLVSFFILLLPAAAKAQEQRAAASAPLTRAEIEEFLLKASIVSERLFNNYQWRIGLDDGKRKHDAAANTEAGTTAAERNHKLNVAAYELDKALELNFVPPSVERTFNGQPASVSWWVDDVAMMEIDRRRKKIEPPDPDGWNRQMQVVRVFDELISNPYRDVNPASHHFSSWDSLLITRDWRFWLIDHTQAFRIIQQLEHPQSLVQCDRALLRKLRELNPQLLKQKLRKYLTPDQLDALEARRKLLVKHFAEQIARRSEGAVLYDLPPRP